jgi:hypothetical protein
VPRRASALFPTPGNLATDGVNEPAATLFSVARISGVPILLNGTTAAPDLNRRPNNPCSVPPHAAEFFWARDQCAFSSGAFLIGRGLVTELIDFTAGHLSSFGCALTASARCGRFGSKGALDEAADGCRPAR